MGKKEKEKKEKKERNDSHTKSSGFLSAIYHTSETYFFLIAVLSGRRVGIPESTLKRDENDEDIT